MAASPSPWSFSPGASQQQILAKFSSELRGGRGGHDERNRAAKELHAYVCTDLREADKEELNAFLDALTKRILELVKAGEAASKLGGVMAIVALINADVCNTNDRVSRFGNYLRNNCLPPNTSDAAVIELASCAIARLTQVSGTYTANVKFELIDHEVKRAFELLAGERNEGKQYAAVLILREIAFSMPTFFFQKISSFYDVIFNCVWDPKPILREAAVKALRAGLLVMAQRETSKSTRTKDKKNCYQISFDHAMSNLDPSPAQLQDKKFQRDDRAHGSVLVLAELFRTANSNWERTYREIQEGILNEENMGASWPGIGGPAPGAAMANVGVGPPRRGQGWTTANAQVSSSSGLGLVRKYYQNNFRSRSSSLSSSSTSTSAATGSAVTLTAQIPFSWFGTVMYGKYGTST